MKKQDGKIYIRQWLELKPYSKQSATDSYYLGLCNKVKKAICSDSVFIGLTMYINDDHIDLLACYLTSYFEDIISGSNIWNTFVQSHKELYQKPLPFFDTGEYYEEEINEQDVVFLIWYFINTIQEQNFVFPTNDLMNDIAEVVMDVFDEAWEYAPENEIIKSCYTIAEDETDFYATRTLIENILFGSYLFYTDSKLNLREKETLIIEEKKDNEDKQTIQMLLYEASDIMVHDEHTRLLGFNGKEWAAKLLGKKHPLYKDILEMTQKVAGLFLYKGQNQEHIFLEHIASGKKFDLVKRSYDNYRDLITIDTVLYMGIVRWKGEWWFSGIQFVMDYNAEMVSDEENSVESRSMVNFLDYDELKVEEIIEKQYAAFMKYTGGQQIVFMETNKIDDFMKGFLEFFNKSIKIPDKKRENIYLDSGEKGLHFNEKLPSDFMDGQEECGLVFFNPKQGVNIAFEINSAFPLDNNPFYNGDEYEIHLVKLFLNEEYSTELVLHCIESVEKTAPFSQTRFGRAIAGDIDFMLRFAKKKHYHSKPDMAFVD